MTGSARLRIGFLGTGIMGFPMARRLAEAGHDIRAWNRSRGKAERLAAFDATVVTSPAEAVRDAEVVICMLSSGPVCDAVLLGPGAALDHMVPGSTLVVMSSIPVQTAQAQRGAADGTLAVLVGGEDAAVDRLRPVFEILGRPTHIGPVGTGELAKLVNQLIVAGTITVVAEALLLAERGGADPATVRAGILGGFAHSTVLEQHAPRMIANDFRPGGPAKHQLKDTATALALAGTLGLELPVSALVDRLFAELVEHGDGDLDHSAVIRELRRHNGLPV
jgi:3-hydroxyisobutyrate dehydrogenase-like beta-hydroxyacid dehydrogenase